MPAIIIHCSCPDRASAERIARALVEESLAACVQVLPGMRSTYRWQGTIEESEEVLLLAKTRRERWHEVERRVRELHPYTVPELLAVDVVEGHAPYLAWLAEGTGNP